MRICLALALLVGCRSGPRILSEYGTTLAVARNDDGTARGRSTPHDGVDVGLYAIGDPVIASADGIVSWANDDRTDGAELVVVHPSGHRTGYLHLKNLVVRVGDHVRRGDTLGEVGLFWASGQVIHVHWRLWRVDHDHGATEDPLPWTVGCFDRRKTYPTDHLALTYPVRC